MAKSTEFTDYANFLTTLDNEGKAYFLEGGQAVNLWAEYYSTKAISRERLSALRPFTSKDCDIWVSLEALDYIEELTSFGTLQKGSSPADGQIAIYTIHGNPTLEVDLMGGVFGIPVNMNNRLYERAINFQGLRVIDPLYLFQSKCQCLVGLPQSDRQDKKHLFILLTIMPEYFCELHEQALQKKIKERDLIKELKLLLKICNLKQVKEALSSTEHRTSDLFPLEVLRSSSLELVHEYTHATLLDKLGF